MTKNIFVALWPNDSFESGITANLPLTSKVEQLRNYVSLANSFLGSCKVRMNMPNGLMLFIAPEYFFIKADLGNGKLEAYSETEKKAIYTSIKAMSKQFPGMLIIPGTVFWKKPRRTPGGKNNDRNFDGYNTAPVFYKGGIRHEYDKKSDDGVCGNGVDTVFKQGVKSQKFKAGGINFGIEVCYDFNQRSLANEVPQGSLDVEIYISGSNTHSFKPADLGRVPVRKGGYFIHCDTSGDAKKVGAWCILPGSGSHGVNRDGFGGTPYDPWTLQLLSLDSHGLSLGVSSMIRVETLNNYAAAKTPSMAVPTLQRQHSMGNIHAKPPPQRRGSLPPAPKPPGITTTSNLQLVWVKVEPVAPGMMENGDFRVSVEAKLTGDQPDLVGKTLTFKTSSGQLTQPSVTTDGRGFAKTFVNCNKSSPATITCEFGGGTISSKVEFVTLGSGNVSKMGQLQPPTNSQLPCWHLAL